MQKTNWPFKDLAIGESCVIPADQAKRAKAYVHVYAAQVGKRMSWKSAWDGSITVTRLPNPVTDRYEVTQEQMEALRAIFGGPSGLKQFAKVVASPHRVYATEVGTVVFETRSLPVTM